MVWTCYEFSGSFDLLPDMGKLVAQMCTMGISSVRIIGGIN
jgi:hypothetical protein